MTGTYFAKYLFKKRDRGALLKISMRISFFGLHRTDLVSTTEAMNQIRKEGKG